MKLTSLKTKTAIEVSDNDLLLIEDQEDTKTISIEQFKIMMSTYNEQRFKLLFNDCLTKMQYALERSKFTIPTVHKYLVNSWIESTSGNVQIALRDLSTGRWLTKEELAVLLLDEKGDIAQDFNVELFAGSVYNKAKSYQLLNFTERYDRDFNSWLYDDNAGFIEVAFGELEQNNIAAIRHSDVKVTIQNRTIIPEGEEDFVGRELQFVFVTSEDYFANSVEYISTI